MSPCLQDAMIAAKDTEIIAKNAEIMESLDFSIQSNGRCFKGGSYKDLIHTVLYLHLSNNLSTCNIITYPSMVQTLSHVGHLLGSERIDLQHSLHITCNGPKRRSSLAETQLSGSSLTPSSIGHSSNLSRIISANCCSPPAG